MADVLRLTQEQGLDYVVKPTMVKGSKLYDTILLNPDNPLAGNAPIGVRFNVNSGDYLNKIIMPNAALQLPATETEQTNDTYTPKSKASSTTEQWLLQEYSLYFKIIKKTIEDLKIKYNVASGAPEAFNGFQSAIFAMVGGLLKNDVTRHAFWSQKELDFATTYPSNTWNGGEPTSTLPLKNGFMKLIQDGVTGGDVPNYPTAGLNGSPLTTAQVKELLKEVMDNTGYILSSLINSDIDIQEKPVWIVSSSVYKAYRRYLQELGSDTSFYFRGFDSNGNVLPMIKALQYDDCMMISASDVFDDWAATSAGLKNQHFAILTSRDNLQIAFNFRAGQDSLTFEEYGQQSGGYGLGISLNPRMDFKIAELSDNGLSVAGFVAPPAP